MGRSSQVNQLQKTIQWAGGAEGLLIPVSCLEYTKFSVFTPQDSLM